MTLPVTLTAVVDNNTTIEFRADPGDTSGLLVLSGPQPGGNRIYIDVDSAALGRLRAALDTVDPPGGPS